MSVGWVCSGSTIFVLECVDSEVNSNWYSVDSPFDGWIWVQRLLADICLFRRRVEGNRVYEAQTKVRKARCKVGQLIIGIISFNGRVNAPGRDPFVY